MAGKGIGELRPARKRDRERRDSRFESLEASRREDATRSSMLRERAESEPKRRNALLALADQIDPAVTARPITFASSRVWRKFRQRLIPALQRLYRQDRGSARTFTLLPAGHRVPAGELNAVDLPRLLSALRAALNRAGANQTRGWIFVSLHGEYTDGDGFCLHFHGLASPSMLPVIRRLRNQAKFTPRGQSRYPDAVPFPVRIARVAPLNLRRALGYLHQGWWPYRDRLVGHSNGDSGDASGPLFQRRRRIPLVPHAELLAWFDQWGPGDLTLMIGLRVVNGEFRITREIVHE